MNKKNARFKGFIDFLTGFSLSDLLILGGFGLIILGIDLNWGLNLAILTAGLGLLVGGIVLYKAEIAPILPPVKPGASK